MPKFNGYWFNMQGSFVTYKYPHCYVSVPKTKSGYHWGTYNKTGISSKYGRYNKTGISSKYGRYNKTGKCSLWATEYKLEE